MGVKFFCNEHGIVRQWTVKGTTQENRMVKQVNRTLMDRARSMLSTASLEQSFWAEAIHTSCYLVNRSPTSALARKISEKVWSGKPVNYSFL